MVIICSFKIFRLENVLERSISEKKLCNNRYGGLRELAENRKILELIMMKHLLSSLLFLLLCSVATTSVFAADDEFVPAYQNEGNYKEDKYHTNEDLTGKYVTRDSGRNYYTSGKDNGFRVNENNEESTDETIGILTFVLAPAAIIYMNVIGWWE